MRECVAIAYESYLLLVVTAHSAPINLYKFYCTKLKMVPLPLWCVLGSLSGVSRLVCYFSPGKICHIAGVCSGRGGVNENICHSITAGAYLSGLREEAGTPYVKI